MGFGFKVSAVNQALHFQIGVEVFEFVRDITVVDVHGHGANLHAGEEGFQIFGAVIELDADIVATPYAFGTQGIAQLVGAGIQLCKTQLLRAADKGFAFGYSGCDDFE